MNELKRLRAELREVDDNILRLIEVRQKKVLEIGLWKKQNKVEIRDFKREEENIARWIATRDPKLLDADTVATVYTALIQAAIKLQTEAG